MNMWMVGYNEGGGEFNMADYAFNGRKLRPLMPRPVTTTTTTSPNNNNNDNTSTPTSIPPCLTRNDFFSQYHNLASTVGVGDQSKRELNNPPAVVVSSRWNPTPEQLRALEELYRRGTRTPSAEQIQQITAQLRRFGKIEGKNVFYWFQNHKARERQKRRRQMESAAEPEFPDTTLLEKKDLGASRTVFEVEHQQTKNWHHPSTNSTTLPEESVSIQTAAKAGAAAGSECRTDGWLQFDEGELQQRRNFMERNATWHMMQLTCPTPTTLAPHLINTLPNYNNSNNMTTTTRLMDPKLIKTHHHDLGLFISPHHHHTHRENDFFHLSSMISSSTHLQDDGVESQTLQLFPLRNIGDDHTTNQHKETEISASAMNAPSQFIEFLPLKN